MRLLTPILEEEETLSSQIGGETGEGGFNRSVMTVISELLTNHSKSMQIYQSLSETRQGREYFNMCFDKLYVIHYIDVNS